MATNAKQHAVAIHLLNGVDMRLDWVADGFERDVNVLIGISHRTQQVGLVGAVADFEFICWHNLFLLLSYLHFFFPAGMPPIVRSNAARSSELGSVVPSAE